MPRKILALHRSRQRASSSTSEADPHEPQIGGSVRCPQKAHTVTIGRFRFRRFRLRFRPGGQKAWWP